ncbi:MAG: O-antigen ligase family protein [Thermoclostridium sp.]|nr:O-antigen ligase family protein [Thermoclostridium sp.]
MKQKIQDELKQLKSDIRSIKSFREFIQYIPSSSLNRIAFWLLTALAASPLYVLLRSILLKYHDSFYLNDNQRTLGTYWVQFIRFIGFSGIFLMLLVLWKNIIMHHQDKRLSKILKSHPVPLFLLLLLVWSVFSYAFSSNKTLSLYGTPYRNEGILTYFAYAGIFCCGYILKEQRFRVNLMRIFVLSATILSILMLINQPELNLLLSFKYKAAMFQNINHYGYFLSLATMLAAALSLREGRLNKASLFWLLPFAILVAALITNKSFGPYVAVVMGLIFLFVLTFIYTKKARLCAGILVLVFILLSFGMNLKSNYLTQEAKTLTKDIVNIVENNETAPKAGSNRWILWKLGIKYTLEKPIFGYGPENLQARYTLDNLNHDRPHNEFIQLSASLGIPALVFYCCALFFFFLPLLKNMKKLNPEIIGLYAAILSYLASSFVGQSMYCSASFYFAFLGLTCHLFPPAGTQPASLADKKQMPE